MNNHADKTEKSKNQSLANVFPHKQTGSKSPLQFVDNRPEAVVQRKLQELANSSPQVEQGTQLQAMANFYSAQQQNPIQMMENTDLTNAVKSGSPATYKVGSKYVKKWKNNGDQKSQTMQNNWDNANTAGVRTPTYAREQLTDTNEYVFWSNECKGSDFFQHSKPGKPTLLKSWLDQGHGDGYLKRLSTMFRNAKMGDPQGFFESGNNGAFEFMDIQQMGSGQMGEYADYIDQKLGNIE